MVSVSDAIDPDKADWVSGEIKGLSGKLEGFGGDWRVNGG